MSEFENCKIRTAERKKEGKMWQIFVKGLDGKTKCVQVTSPVVSGGDLKERLFNITRIPPQCQRLLFGTRDLADDALIDGKSEAGAHPPCINLLLRLRGGKGGFGSLLRGAATKAGQKKTTNFDACRDMSGRRLRHVNAEKQLEEWKADAHERQLEKIAEAYIKKQSKLKSRCPSESAASDLHDYTAQASKARVEVESAVKDGLVESLNLQLHAKRKLSQTQPQFESKRPKLWMAEEENEDDDDDEDFEEEEEGFQLMVSKNEDSGSGSSSSLTKDEMLPSHASKGKSHAESSSDDDDSACQAAPLSGESDSGYACERESSMELRKENGASPNSIQEESAMLPVLVDGHVCCEANVETCQGLPTEVTNSEATVKQISEVAVSVGENDSVSERSDVTEEPINFDDFDSAGEMEVLGLERLKNELQSRGLKCGGSLSERAARLFLLKTTPLEKLHKKHFSKPKDAGK